MNKNTRFSIIPNSFLRGFQFPGVILKAEDKTPAVQHIEIPKLAQKEPRATEEYFQYKNYPKLMEALKQSKQLKEEDKKEEAKVEKETPMRLPFDLREALLSGRAYYPESRHAVTPFPTIMMHKEPKPLHDAPGIILGASVNKETGKVVYPPNTPSQIAQLGEASFEDESAEDEVLTDEQKKQIKDQRDQKISEIQSRIAFNRENFKKSLQNLILFRKAFLNVC